MNREAFCSYFEAHFFSNNSQDLVTNKEIMLNKLGESPFIKDLLVSGGCEQMYQFLRAEYDNDKWESLIDFFVENGMLMMDMYGDSSFMEQQNVDVIEIIYRDLLCDIYETMRIKDCTMEDLKHILIAQHDRLVMFKDMKIYKKASGQVKSEEIAAG